MADYTAEQKASIPLYMRKYIVKKTTTMEAPMPGALLLSSDSQYHISSVVPKGAILEEDSSAVPADHWAHDSALLVHVMYTNEKHTRFASGFISHADVQEEGAGFYKGMRQRHSQDILTLER